MNKVSGILLVLLILALSGCVDETKDASQIPAATTQPEIEENEPEIDIASYYRVYIRDNQNENDEWVQDIFIRYYVIYNLSIINNGSTSLNFNLNDLHLYSEYQIFNATNLREPNITKPFITSKSLEIQSTLGNETTIFQNQTISRSVVFKVDNHNKPFLLKYNTTPITSTSLEKSLIALTTAELFDYSPVFGKPPYRTGSEIDTYNPEPFKNFPYNEIWSNWVNRSVFEYYNKTDIQYMYRNSSLKISLSDKIPLSEIVYVLKVIPESNITMLPSDDFIVVNDKGEEIVNRSAISRKYPSIAILNGQNYKHYSKENPQMNISNATVVQISFGSIYGWSMAMRFTFNDQYVIVDEEQNILLVRYDESHFIS